MKKLLTGLAFMLFSISIFACPQLTGDYICNDNGGGYSSIVSQTQIDGITHYRIEDIDGVEEIIADGNWRQVQEFGVPAKVRATCSDGLVKLEVLAQIYVGYTLDIVMKVGLDSNGQLVTVTQTTANGHQLSEKTETCKKI